MKKKCLNCPKEFEQPEGKREKKFCSDKCRASYAQKNNNPSIEFKEEENGRWTLPDGKSGNFYFKYGLNKGKELTEVVEENNKPENKERIEAERNGDGEKVVPALYVPLGEGSGGLTLKAVYDLSGIQKQIDAIRAEKIPKERDTPLGKKVWQKEQDAKIKELQKQIK